MFGLVDRVIPVADKLMIARVIYCYISFSQLPYGIFNTLLYGHVNFTNGTILISLRTGQAQLDGQWLQSAIVLQEKNCPAGIEFCRSVGVYPPHVWHQCIMVIQYEQLLLSNCLFNHIQINSMNEKI